MAVADVQPDGTVHIYTHNQNPQALRGEIAHDATHYARSCDRACVSRTGPLRKVERRERWRGRRGSPLVTSPRQTGARAVDARRRYAMVHAIGGCFFRYSDCHRRKRQNRRVSKSTTLCPPCRTTGPSARSSRGCPPCRPPMSIRISSTATINSIADPWVYAPVPNVVELGHGTFQVGQKASPLAVGLRDHSMRTPGSSSRTFRANWRSAKQQRSPAPTPCSSASTTRTKSGSIGVLKAVRDASGWDTRPSPRPDAVSTGSTPVRGRGVSLMFRSGTYWACVCQIAVTPEHRGDRGGEVHDRGRSRHRREPGPIEAAGRRRCGHGNQPCPARRGDV